MQDTDVRRRSPVPTASIDFLRGVAAIYVVLNHTRGAFFAGGRAMIANGHTGIFDKVAIAALSVTGLGAEFVIFFFILSGFAMAHSVQNTDSTAAFYGKRVVRVWIPYIGAVATAAIICAAIGILSPAYPLLHCQGQLCTVPGILSILLYLSPSTELTPQFWSLPYEILFYLAAPVILATRARVHVCTLLALTGTAISALRYGLAFNPSQSIVANFFLQEWLLFQIGATAYLLFDRLPRLKARYLWPAVALTLAAVIVIKNHLGTETIVTNAIMAALTLMILRSMPAALGRSPANLGKFSYSIYIFHYAMIATLRYVAWRAFGLTQEHMTSYFAWIFTLPIILGYCLTMWWVFERPTLLWLARLRHRHAQPLSGPAVQGT